MEGTVDLKLCGLMRLQAQVANKCSVGCNVNNSQ